MVSDLRAAAQQALEAIEDSGCKADLMAAADALRAALAEPQDEPVAWMVYTEGGKSAYVTDNPTDLVGAYRALPLYTR